LRFGAMFALGVAISVELATLRFIHVALWLPGRDVQYVPRLAVGLFGLSRVAALVFIAGVLHENFGHPLHWYTPVAGITAVMSMLASIIVQRTNDRLAD
jgi:hypothetical protein